MKDYPPVQVWPHASALVLTTPTSAAEGYKGMPVIGYLKDNGQWLCADVMTGDISSWIEGTFSGNLYLVPEHARSFYPVKKKHPYSNGGVVSKQGGKNTIFKSFEDEAAEVFSKLTAYDDDYFPPHSNFVKLLPQPVGKEAQKLPQANLNPFYNAKAKKAAAKLDEVVKGAVADAKDKGVIPADKPEEQVPASALPLAAPSSLLAMVIFPFHLHEPKDLQTIELSMQIVKVLAAIQDLKIGKLFLGPWPASQQRSILEAWLLKARQRQLKDRIQDEILDYYLEITGEDSLGAHQVQAAGWQAEQTAELYDFTRKQIDTLLGTLKKKGDSLHTWLMSFLKLGSHQSAVFHHKTSKMLAVLKSSPPNNNATVLTYQLVTVIANMNLNKQQPFAEHETVWKKVGAEKWAADVVKYLNPSVEQCQRLLVNHMAPVSALNWFKSAGVEDADKAAFFWANFAPKINPVFMTVTIHDEFAASQKKFILFPPDDISPDWKAPYIEALPSSHTVTWGGAPVLGYNVKNGQLIAQISSTTVKLVPMKDMVFDFKKQLVVVPEIPVYEGQAVSLKAIAEPPKPTYQLLGNQKPLCSGIFGLQELLESWQQQIEKADWHENFIDANLSLLHNDIENLLYLPVSGDTIGLAQYFYEKWTMLSALANPYTLQVANESNKKFLADVTKNIAALQKKLYSADLKDEPSPVSAAKASDSSIYLEFKADIEAASNPEKHQSVIDHYYKLVGKETLFKWLNLPKIQPYQQKFVDLSLGWKEDKSYDDLPEEEPDPLSVSDVHALKITELADFAREKWDYSENDGSFVVYAAPDGDQIPLLESTSEDDVVQTVHIHNTFAEVVERMWRAEHRIKSLLDAFDAAVPLQADHVLEGISLYSADRIREILQEEIYED